MRDVCVNAPEQALDRIRNRVLLGGHDAPEPDVRRRYARSLARLPAAIERSDEARLYDNGDPDRPHREVAVLTADTRWTAEAVMRASDARRSLSESDLGSGS